MISPLLQERPVTRLTESQRTLADALGQVTRPRDASSMPTLRQTTQGVEALLSSPQISSQFSGLPLSQIRSARQAPSAVVTEQFLAARISSSPGYLHHAASTKAEHISNLYAEAPRFRNQIDMLA